MKNIEHRINRLEGQLENVKEKIQQKADCAAVVPQLLAAHGAMDSLVRAYLEISLEECADNQDREKTQHLIKLLIKHL